MSLSDETPDASSCLHFILRSLKTTSISPYPSWARGALGHSEEPVPIAVIGAKGSGKTSFVNMATGSYFRVETNLKPGIAQAQFSNDLILDGQQVVLIDTPGFDDVTVSDTDILKSIAALVATAYGEGSKLAGIIYIHCISDKRFPEISVRNFKMFRELCGDTTLESVVLVTNMWGEVSQDVGEARERELITKSFKPVLDKGAQIARYHYNPQSAHDIIRRIMKNQPARPWAAEDEEMRKEETRKLREELNRLRVESEWLASAHSEERKRMEEEMWRMRAEAREVEKQLLDRLNSCPRQCPWCGL